MKVWRGRIILILFLAAMGGGGFWLFRARQVQAKADLPTAAARRGEFRVIVRCRGELISTHSVQLVAPINVPGLQIMWQAPPNSVVKKGDVVVKFDSSTARQQLIEKQAALQQAQATLDQGVAQARTTAEQDQLDLASARVEVERARLEVSKQEVVSRLQGEESKIDLGVAEEKLKVQEATNDLHVKVNEHKIASAKRLLDKAQEEIDLNNQRLALMEMHAPSDGIIVYLTNNSQGWVNAKPFKIGDQVWAGSAVAELPDLSTLEMKGKLEEIDRGRISLDEDASILVDPFPEKPFVAKVSAVSPLVEQSFDWPPQRNFRVQAKFTNLDPRLRPGMNARVDVVVDRIADAISVPASAVFTRQGRPVVYVTERGAWVPKEVEVLAKNPDEVAIRGVQAGTKVALTEPDAQTNGVSPDSAKPTGGAPK